MDIFVKVFKNELNTEFDGYVTPFQKFNSTIDSIFESFGLDIIHLLINDIDIGDTLKSVIILEPKEGTIFFVHAKQYINKEKVSFLIPLILNSANLFYGRILNEKINVISLNTFKNEHLQLEKRDKVVIIKQYIQYGEDDIEPQLLTYFKNKKKLSMGMSKQFSSIIDKLKSSSEIQQFFFVDLVGKVLDSHLTDINRDYKPYIAEIISFFTSSKKVCEEIYNRQLFHSSINGVSLSTVCVNFKNFALILLSSGDYFSIINKIHAFCINILK
jgi:hypothetical protein